MVMEGLVQDSEAILFGPIFPKKTQIWKNPQNPKSSAEDPTLKHFQVIFWVYYAVTIKSPRTILYGTLRTSFLSWQMQDYHFLSTLAGHNLIKTWVCHRYMKL